MDQKKIMVVTAYGHKKTTDKISVSSFETAEDAETYCDALNSLELKGDSWVFARVVSENKLYALDGFLPLNFSDVILKLDDRAIQKMLRDVDSQELTRALKDQDEPVQEKIFGNMSKRASCMLQEDMEYMGPVRLRDVKESQRKILDIIHCLEQNGEIVISCCEGEPVV